MSSAIGFACLLWAAIAYLLLAWRGENARTRLFTSIHIDLTENKGRRARRMRDKSRFSGTHLGVKAELKGPTRNPFDKNGN